MTKPRLIGDIGGTYARFALIETDGAIAEPVRFHTGDYETIAAALSAFVETIPPSRKPGEAALAIAAPIIGDCVAMTNGPWTFSIEATRKAFGWSALHVINDFAAHALAVPYLKEEDVRKVGDGTSVKDCAIAVVGPGTGLGVAALVPANGHWTVVPGEGGHATLAAMDSREAAVIDILHRQYSHVSAERTLSGPGLVNLYDCLCELAGKPAAAITPEYITNLYPGCDPQAREAVGMFCAMLGTFAGNIALTFGARGGVYIMGGIVPDIFEIFRHSQFRDRFEFKGRYRPYVSQIATYVVMHPHAAFLGLKTLFEPTTAATPGGKA